MNIAQAKEEIKNSIMAYLMKDAFGKSSGKYGRNKGWSDPE